MNAVKMGMEAWSAGIIRELAFWDLWIQTRGSNWPQEFERRLRTDTVIDSLIGNLLYQAGPGARLLDVGSGPITSIHKTWPGTDFLVFACDPLASLYSHLLDQYAIAPPVRTQLAPAEDLSAFYEVESFDVVHCQNALDHSFDPVRGIKEMLRITKLGGHIVLRHQRNEAETQKYGGFHQYNFDEQSGRFIVWNRSGKTYIDEHIPDSYGIRCVRFGDDRSVELIIKKEAKLVDEPTNQYYRERVRELITGMLSYFTDAALTIYRAQSGKAPAGGTAPPIRF